MTSAQKSKSRAKKPNGKNTINAKSGDYIIYTQIEGMCSEFKGNIKDNLKDITVENFFPFVHKIEMTFGYLLKLEGEENYRILSQANWRTILNGKIKKLRPADKLPENNRIKVFDNETEKEIEICYWPDNYYNSVKKIGSNVTKNNQKSNKSGDAKSTKKTQPPVSKATPIENRLEKSSFGFLIASVKKTDVKNPSTVDEVNDDITDTLIEHLFKNNKKRKRGNRSSEMSDSSDEMIEIPIKKQKLSDDE